MASTEEEIDICQRNHACLGFKHPGMLLHRGFSMCLRKKKFSDMSKSVNNLLNWAVL